MKSKNLTVRRRPHLGAPRDVRRLQVRLGRPGSPNPPDAAPGRRARRDRPRKHRCRGVVVLPAVHALLGDQRPAAGARSAGLRAHPDVVVPGSPPRHLLGLLDRLQQRRGLLRADPGRFGGCGVRVEVGHVCSGAGRDRVELGEF